MIFLTSCGGTKEMGNTKTVKPSKPKGEEVVELGGGKVDTIHWRQVDRSKEYNSTIEDLDLEKKDSYNVSLLFPFELDNSNNSDTQNPESKLFKMANYYAGVTMALHKLEEDGVNLQVQVLDSEAGNFDSKLQQCKDADVIIGPRATEQLTVTANYGKINNIPVISPWKSGSKISTDNPYFVQLKTGLKNHFSKMVQHAKSEFPDDQIVILGRNNRREDLTYMQYMQEVAAAINNDANEKPLRELYIDEDSLKLGVFAFQQVFIKDQATVFLLPNWSFISDEDFVYNTARKMSGEKGSNTVILYGMPIILESDKIKFDLYRGLNMRICRSTYVDRSSIDIKEFRQKYFSQFASFPSDEAMEGYDMMIFIGRSLFNYGRKFQYFLDTYESSLLQTKFDIQKVYDPDADDSFKSIQYFQNDHLYILSFESDKFVIK